MPRRCTGSLSEAVEVKVPSCTTFFTSIILTVEGHGFGILSNQWSTLRDIGQCETNA